MLLFCFNLLLFVLVKALPADILPVFSEMSERNAQVHLQFEILRLMDLREFLPTLSLDDFKRYLEIFSEPIQLELLLDTDCSEEDEIFKDSALSLTLAGYFPDYCAYCLLQSALVTKNVLEKFQAKVNEIIYEFDEINDLWFYNGLNDELIQRISKTGIYQM